MYLPMLMMKKILIEDINSFLENFSLKADVNCSSILVTGGTGLIGSVLVKCLLGLNVDVRITLPARSLEKAKTIYGSDLEKLHLIECELTRYLETMDEQFDYIVHLASPTEGKYMVEHPVETYSLATDSTKLILEYCQRNKVKSLVYVSSLEYYGQNSDDSVIKEDFLGYIDATSPRSCYPLGKRAAEYLCTAYAAEYKVPVKIARLTQTFGAGVSTKDNRVFAQFARSIIEGRNIVMHTKGESAKPYCYTTDCVSAILYILLRGKNGEAYNVANQDSYISIKDMALFLKKNFNPHINVIVEEHPEMGYAPITKLNLSAEKLMNLGWKPRYDLRQMFEHLIKALKEKQ